MFKLFFIDCFYKNYYYINNIKKWFKDRNTNTIFFHNTSELRYTNNKITIMKYDNVFLE